MLPDNNENTRKEIDIETPEKKNEDITTNIEKEEKEDKEDKENTQEDEQKEEPKRGDRLEHKKRENPDNPTIEDTEWVNKSNDDTAMINDEDKETGTRDARKDSILDNPKYETYESNKETQTQNVRTEKNQDNDQNKEKEELRREKNSDAEKNRMNKNKQTNPL